MYTSTIYIFSGYISTGTTTIYIPSVYIYIHTQNKKEEEEIIVFQTRGWVTGTHSHKIKDNKINKDIVVLCDVCPVCGHITEEEVYRGDGNPILLGVYSHVEETHGSKFHGAMPYGIKVEDREILDYIENTYFREDQDE